jgi:hypothetical protein
MKSISYTLRLPADLVQKVDRLAEAKGWSRAKLLIAAVLAYLPAAEQPHSGGMPSKADKMAKATRKAHRSPTVRPTRAQAVAALPEPLQGLVKPATAILQPTGCPKHGPSCGFAKSEGLWFCRLEGRAVTI